MLVGIDVGGTNIDGAIIEKGKILKSTKLPADSSNLLDSVNNCLDDLLEGVDTEEIERINLSTTVSTNAIVEGNTSPVGLILQKGPGINYDFSDITDYVEEITGYVDHRGIKIKDMDPEEVNSKLEKFLDAGLDSLSIVTKFSPRNNTMEEEIEALAKDKFKNISLGHHTSGKLNFPRRVNTSVLNSAVMNVFLNFAENIKIGVEERNIDAPINILKADGGTMTLADGLQRPVETILSGPAASFMGIMALMENKEDAILVDIGGTTTDIFFVVNQSPLFEPMGASIDNHRTLVRALYSQSIGLGGDSAIKVDNGELQIGPKRLGNPMALGGSVPTPTDAMIVLGKLDAGDPKKAEEGVAKLAEELGMTTEATAEQILQTVAKMLKAEVDRLLEIINNKPLYTVKEVLENKQLEPKELRLIGGPVSILGEYIEEEFQLKTSYPKKFEVANAIGAALAIPSFEINLIADTGRKILSVPELGIYEKISKSYNLDKAKDRALKELEETGYEAEVVEEESFNMIHGFRQNKNIRLKAQLKPGLEYKLGDVDESKE